MGAKTLLTIAEFEQLPEVEGIHYELDQGELVEMSGASYAHNRIRDEVAGLLRDHLRRNRGQGSYIAEQWFRVGADTVRAPDVALVGPSQQALVDSSAGIQPFAPTMAVEIASPSNTYDELLRKTRQYLDAGTQTVWIVVTPAHEVHVYSATEHPKILCAEDLLEEPRLLPGFSVRVADLFDV